MGRKCSATLGLLAVCLHIPVGIPHSSSPNDSPSAPGQAMCCMCILQTLIEARFGLSHCACFLRVAIIKSVLLLSCDIEKSTQYVNCSAFQKSWFYCFSNISILYWCIKPIFFAFGSLTKKSVKVVLTHSDNLVRLNHNDLFLCYCPVPYMKCVYVHKIFYCIFRTFTFIMDLWANL